MEEFKRLPLRIYVTYCMAGEGKMPLFAKRQGGKNNAECSALQNAKKVF